ncbi:hypothetical protein [Bifidobacterium oedipodis]|uniref:Uncharacterized protein n=1 Tax=Bifidobacterium oedipodis TaxID=2675322 RepID=A0A7Y0EQ90_9BIFI|nr:hypothetical protein [Bifidobacterium sp. DSM 109957]NMM94390.1 hypothetical protein [Bifidobacterium sp. DSM 109957]
MSKANYVTLVLGTVSALVFALGMCMCLLPEWNAFTPGVVVGVIGVVLFLVTWMVRRRFDGKPAIVWNAKAVGVSVYALVSALVLGAGMCLTMVFTQWMIPGIVVGIVGIVMLLGLIPMIKGIK